MKKAVLFFLFFYSWALYAQENPVFDRESFFSQFDYSTAPTGLLRDLSVEPVDLDQFDGTAITDSNYVNLVSMAGIFKAMQTADVTGTRNWTYSFPNASDVYIPLMIASYEYNYLDSLALQTGGLTYNGYGIRRLNTTIPCYNTKHVFAIVPKRPYSSSLDVRYQFCYLPNKNVMQDYVELDADDGLGYRNAVGVSGVEVHYSSPGVKEIKMRIRVDGEYLESHTQMLISNDNESIHPVTINRVFPVDSISCTYQGKEVSAVLEYRYAGGDGVLRKPFIFVEGYDPWDLTQVINPNAVLDSSLGQKSLEDVEGIVDLISPTYDIIYVNWLNSEADIRANATLLIKIIKERVNDVKVTTIPSVVFGESMGGLIARYALCRMDADNRSPYNEPYDYQVESFISHDVPHLGVNVPIGALQGIRALEDYFNSISLFQHTSKEYLSLILKYLNGMSAKQMLYNYVGEDGHIDNSVHDSFFHELAQLGNFPVGTIDRPVRNIAISDGGYTGVTDSLQVQNNSYFRAKINIDYGLFFELFYMSLMDPIFANGLSTEGNLDWYFYLPGASSIEYSLSINADNGNSARLMQFSGWYTKKLLGIIPFDDCIVSKSSQERGAIPNLEMSRGSVFTISESMDTLANISQSDLSKLFNIIDDISIHHIDRILFVPTESALAAKQPNYSRNQLQSPLVPLVDTRMDSYQIPNTDEAEGHTVYSIDYDWLRYELNALVVGPEHGITGDTYSVAYMPSGVDASDGHWYSHDTSIAEIDDSGTITVHSNGLVDICYAFYENGRYYGVNKWIEVSTESDVTSIQLYLDGVLDNGNYYARVNPLTNADRINWNLAMQDSVVRQNCTYSWRYMLDFGALRNSESGSLAELYDDLEEGEFPSLSIMPMLRDANNIIRVFFTVSEHLGETTKSKTISKAFYVDDLNAQLWPQSLIVNPNQIMAVYGGAVQDVFLSPPPRLIHQNSVASVCILDEEGVELTELPVESEGYVQLFDNEEVLDFLDDVLTQNEEMAVLRFILKDASGQVLEERALPIVVKDVTYEAL